MNLTQLLDGIAKPSDVQNMRIYLARLEAAYEWARAQQPVWAGDHAVLAPTVPPIDPGSGWWIYRHLFVPGNVVEVGKVDFVHYDRNRWYASIMFEDEWIEFDHGTWSAHVASKSTYVPQDGEYFERPNDKVGFRTHAWSRHTFSVPVTWVQR